MTLLTQIKQDQLQARKDKDQVKVGILTTLVSEAAMIGKNDGNRESTDAEVIATIKKFIKNTDETISLLEKEHGDLVAKPLREREILMSYLPHQLTDEELLISIDEIITELQIDSLKGMGLVMKTLKERYEGQFDGKTASALVKERLSR